VLLNSYRPANLFDELIDAHGQVRPYYQPVAERLFSLAPDEVDQKVKNLELLFLKQGVTFTVYGDEKGTERVFPFDPVPRLIPGAEWEVVEAGLIQRMTALNLFLYDVYHEQKILKDKGDLWIVGVFEKSVPASKKLQFEPQIVFENEIAAFGC
jgi:uncharacterized circularly permuted ATP-grasp superfamily protein